MTHPVDLSGPRFAGLVAPAVDRAFIAGMLAARRRGGTELTQRYGGRAATGFLGDFRTRLAAPGGTVSAAGFAALTRYGDRDECERVVDSQVAHGMLVRHADGGLEATERGRAFLTELYALHAAVLGELWEADHAPRVARLVAQVGRLLAAAGATGGDAFAAMAPPYEPDRTPPGVLLLNRLGTLRYHRADAHAAAWRAAGHTAQTIAALPPGREREAVEAATNRLAAPPYAQLTPDERVVLLADLAALPG